MKKVLTLLIATLLVVTFCTPMAAREESDAVLLFDAEKAFGSFSLDRNEMTEGDASVSVKLSGEAFVAGYTFPRGVDITGCDTIAIDIYVSDLDKVAALSNVFFEISSSGTCDKDELQWEFAAQLKDANFEEGWNTVYLDLGVATEANNLDETAINFIRFYTFHSAAANGLVIKLDNVRACVTGGEDFSDMELKAYQGDNSDADVIIQGQSAPDLTKRDEGITKVAGMKK